MTNAQTPSFIQIPGTNELVRADARIGMLIREGKPVFYAYMRPEHDGQRVYVESADLSEVEWYLRMDDKREA